MSNPQQPELARSRKTPAQDPDAAAAVLEGQRQPSGEPGGGPVPPENQPGHHPPTEQDKPDPQAFAEKFGIAEPEPAADEPVATPRRAAEAVPPAARRPAYAGGLVGAAVVIVGLLFLRGRRRRRRR